MVSKWSSGYRQQQSNGLCLEFVGQQEVLPLLGCTAPGDTEAAVPYLFGVRGPPSRRRRNERTLLNPPAFSVVPAMLT